MFRLSIILSGCAKPELERIEITPTEKTVEVKLISDRQGDIIQQPAKTNQKGLATGSIRSTEPGLSTISAVIKDISLPLN